MNKKNIAMLGPVYPYKGGIAHYTALMYKQLKKHNSVTMFSYSVQYPKFLYPGGEQKDFKNDTFKLENVEYLLNTVNPISCIRTAKAINKIKPDLLIIQWWHPFFAFSYYILCKFLNNKIKILFVCHNVFPHESFPLVKQLTKKVLKQGDMYIVQSKIDERNLKKLFESPHYVRTVHPTYNAFKKQNLTKSDARKLLNIEEDENILLFFGFVRKYKGLKYILEAMPEIHKSIKKCKLLIVGDFWEEDKKEYLHQIDLYNINNQVEIYDGYIPDDEVEKYFAASDLVVLPYESATQSGIVQIAYGFNIPVIATRVGGLPEVITDNKTGYLIEPKDTEELAKKIITFFTEDKAQEFEKYIKEEAYRFSWERMEKVIFDLMENRKD